MLLSYDVSKMRELLESFYTLTKIRIVVFDADFDKIVEFPERDSAFCSEIRKNAQAEKRCRTQDRFACEQCKATNSLYAYTCHAGLTETVAPIHYGNIIIGYLMFGQVLLSNDAANDWDKVWARCSGYGVDKDALLAAYRRKTPVDVKQVYAAAQILEACAGYLWLQRYISLRENELPRQLDEYITNNLDADLSAMALCREFGISRSRLYKIAGEYYGKGIEQITRRLRIDKAKELLKAGEHSVTEVAALCGYPDYNYFIKVFKKEVGMTPKQYGLRYLG